MGGSSSSDTLRAIQVHGGAGSRNDFPLAAMHAGLRAIRLADSPDEVHKQAIARHQLRRAASEARTRGDAAVTVG